MTFETQAQEAAAKRKAEEEAAVAEAAKAAAAAAAAAQTPLQGASKKKPVAPNMLKGAKMAFSSAPSTGAPNSRVTLSKVSCSWHAGSNLAVVSACRTCHVQVVSYIDTTGELRLSQRCLGPRIPPRVDQRQG